jgi:hypothetical protein
VNGTTDPPAYVLAEIERDKSDDFVRVADRIRALVAKTLDGVDAIGDTAEEIEALRSAHERASLLGALGAALASAATAYRIARER